ncbi:hypothetical protein Tco_0340983 [Tanacetum coccineum]
MGLQGQDHMGIGRRVQAWAGRRGQHVTWREEGVPHCAHDIPRWGSLRRTVLRGMGVVGEAERGSIGGCGGINSVLMVLGREWAWRVTSFIYYMGGGHSYFLHVWFALLGKHVQCCSPWDVMSSGGGWVYYCCGTLALGRWSAQSAAGELDAYERTIARFACLTPNPVGDGNLYHQYRDRRAELRDSVVNVAKSGIEDSDLTMSGLKKNQMMKLPNVGDGGVTITVCGVFCDDKKCSVGSGWSNTGVDLGIVVEYSTEQDDSSSRCPYAIL